MVASAVFGIVSAFILDYMGLRAGVSTTQRLWYYITQFSLHSTLRHPYHISPGYHDTTSNCLLDFVNRLLLVLGLTFLELVSNFSVLLHKLSLANG